ncbi:MAG: dihydroneopterin aldolase [Desulfitibacter sp. BRH_c19]|nr:MAG: dihydroneopterin aldolase [Desulfitibacter sp. BRH_c19]
MEKSDVLLLKGLQFWGSHGHFPEENRLGQKFVVDAEVSYDMSKICQSDVLEDGLSYVTVYNIIKKIVTEEEHKLVQRIAQRIADDVIACYPIKQIKVTIKKPAVAIGGIVEYTGCSIVREPNS